MFAEILKWIDPIDDVSENLVEDVIDTSAAQALHGHVAHEPSFQLFGVFFEEFADQVQNDWTHAVLVHGEVLLIVCEQFSLFLLDGERDLLSEIGDAALDVADQDAIEGLGQVRDAHL